MNKIIIGICAYNEEDNIKKLLENLLNEQSLNKDSKILVVCSGCEDRTPEIVKRFHEKDRRVSLVLQEKRMGKANALNIIFKEASNKNGFLVLLNADTSPKKGSIPKLISSFTDEKIGATMGRPVPVNKKRGISNGIVRVIWYLHHTVSSHKKMKLSAELCALRTSAVKEIPSKVATDEPYIEMQLRSQGFKIRYVPKAVVFIKGPDNIKELLKQRRRIMTGHLQIKNSADFEVSTSSVQNVVSSFIIEPKPFTSKLKMVPYLLVGSVVEGMAYLTARLDYRKNRIPYSWEPITSTKKL